MDASIARLAAEQFGVVGTTQLQALEISRAVLRTHRRRELAPAGRTPRVLAVGGAPPSW